MGLVSMTDEEVSYEAAHQADWESMATLITTHRPRDGIVSPADLPMDAAQLADRVWIVHPGDDVGPEADSAGRSIHVALWDRTRDVLSACTVTLPAMSVTHTVQDPVSPPSAMPQAAAVRIAVRPDARRAGVADVVYSTDLPLGAAVHSIVQGELDAAVLQADPYRSIPNAAYGVAMHHGLIVRWADGAPVTFEGSRRAVGEVIVSRPDSYRRVQSLFG